ncbi:MAG: sulfatase-like hydrolase/transferase, partial [Bryobacterales bacterium]|nr:sulfatase-like hydrolase/transferase [Bryobacterales bacterium]
MTALAAMPFGCSDSSDTLALKRPNIIVTMADDMGFSDIGCYGGEINTPVLDSLAADGLRFRSFYNFARCCPTRASLITGLYPHQAGVGHMMSEYRKDGEPIPSYMGNLNKSCVTIAEVLGQAGYTTLMSGKWHVTPAEGSGSKVDRSNWPMQRGFDKFFGTIHGAGSFYDPVSLTRGNEPEDPGPDFYYTTAIGD